MKTVVLGDTHGRSFWKLILNIEKPGRVIFIGDYFDTHEDISAVEQIFNYKEIIAFKNRHTEIEMIMLIGNHDHHYFPEVGYTGTSGYQFGAAPNISQVLEETKEHLQMAYMMDNILFTHAGVSETWLTRHFEDKWRAENIAHLINGLWSFKPKYPFQFNGREPTGNDITQTPIWIRPASLMRDTTSLRNEIIQVVGHTQMKEIDKGKATGGRYYFIDTLGSSGEYLVIENNIITVNKI